MGAARASDHGRIGRPAVSAGVPWDEVLDDPALLERIVLAAAQRSPGAAAGGRPQRPSYAWPVFLGLVGSAVASGRARRAGVPRWPYWALGAASTAALGWALLTVMPAALGRGEHARSMYGTIPRQGEGSGDSYVPQGVPGVTDLPDVVPEEHHHGPASALDLEPPVLAAEARRPVS